MTLEWCTTIAGLELAHRQAVLTVERRYASHFLQDWLLGRLHGASEIYDRAQILGWRLADGYCALFVAPCPDQPLSAADAAHVKGVLQDLLERRFGGQSGNLVGPLPGGVVILCPADAGAALGARVAEAIRLDAGAVPVRIGVGRYYRRLEEVPRSVTQAQKAVEVAAACNLAETVVHFNALGVLRLLHLIARHQESREFLTEVIEPLAEYDRVNRTELLRTLEAFFRHKGNAKAVSAELFTHYHTVLYRLERIQAVTGMDLDNPEQRLELQIALKLLQVARHAGEQFTEQGVSL